jgi:hypothetical protein
MTTKQEGLTSTETLAKLWVILREELVSADRNHPMRSMITVAQAEKFTKIVDSFYKG